ncbi:MAG: leucine-rich repeat domain-containing protein [Oscillospiraceae bacterium]|jgi:hypothetical protein|nr:leucine-rich repeat domain-containing protein [Oscillospiraceae bacterium]
MKANHCKRIAALLLACALMALTFTGCFGRESDKQNHTEYTLNEDGKSYTLVYFSDTQNYTKLEINAFNGLPVTVIGEYAIQSAEHLEEIVIGPNVTEIRDWAIILNQHLKNIFVAADNPNYCDEDGVLFSKDKTVLVAYPNGQNVVFERNGSLEKKADYTVPEGTRTIAHNAFMKTQGLRAVTFPASLREISDSAFIHSAVEEITIAEGLTAIGNDAFIQCDELKQLTLPSTLQSIGDYAFYLCTNKELLENFTILAPEAQVKLGKGALPTVKGKAIVPHWAEATK